MTRKYLVRPLLLALERRDLPSFFTSPSFAAGPFPVAVAVADFNGNGVPDIAVANPTTVGTVSILIAKPGGYHAPVSYAAGEKPRDVIAADFDGDGDMDLAVANDSLFSNLTIPRGNGDGTFQSPVSYNAGSYPSAVVGGDFDDDGDTDLAVANQLGSNVAAFRNDGNGNFTHAGTVSVDTDPKDLVVGDFDGDDDLDLIAVGYYYDAGAEWWYDRRVKALLGNGDCTFQGGALYEDFMPIAAATGDFNGDGNLDLAVSHGTGYNRVTVWRGNGDGTFAFEDQHFTGTFPRSVIAVDVDGDSRIDLVTSNEGSGSLSVLTGTGTVDFELTSGLLAGTTPRYVAAADLDGDVDLDLIVANRVTTGTVTILRNAGGGLFQAVQTYAAGAAPPYGTIVTDFDDDGNLDVAVTNSAFPPGKVTVLLGNESGGFQPSTSFAAGPTPANLAVGDFDLNGFPDLAVPNSWGANTVSVLLGKGDGTFFPVRTFNAGPSPESAAVGDVTGDGIPDIVVTNNTNPGTISVLRGTGTGRFRGPFSFAAGSFASGVAIGDFDGDGDRDVAVTNVAETNALRVLLNASNGSFAPPVSYSAGSLAIAIVAADFDGDSKLDIALTNPHSQGSTLRTLKGNGDGTFQAAVSYAAPNSSLALTVADFDANGTLDIASANQLSNNISVYRNTGSGTFHPAVDFFAGAYPRSLAAADFDGDGDADLAIGNHVIPGGVTVLLNDGVWPAPLPVPPIEPSADAATARAWAPPPIPVEPLPTAPAADAFSTPTKLLLPRAPRRAIADTELLDFAFINDGFQRK